MAPSNDMTLPVMKRSRKSIGAHLDLSRISDKENATIDVAGTLAASRKKSRSKSIGPGGLDTLKHGHGNRRASLAIPPNPPRSILKATVAPLPEIPPLKKGRQSIAPGLGNGRGIGAVGNDFGGSRIALKTEEQQQAEAREREERDRRDARRKSLANRRVSFAAEATLHTFHEIEYMNDASKLPNNEPASGSQGKGRTSSIAAQSHFHNVEDDTAGSSVYSSDSEPADIVEEIADEEVEEVEEVEEDSNSDSDDGTMMSVVTEEITGTSIGSDDSEDADEVDDSSTLDEALRMAARQAATQRLDEDSDDGEEIIPSFGWAKKGNQQAKTSHPKAPIAPALQHDIQQDEAQEEIDMELGMDMDTDMEMTRPVGRILKQAEASHEREREQEISMDVTRAFGGILPQHHGMSLETDRDSPLEEATMEFTTAIGGIHRPHPAGANALQEEDENSDVGNEDMSMELTSVIGGLLKKKSDFARRRTLNHDSEAALIEDAPVDMTVGLGRIISAPKQGSDDEGDVSMAMDTSMGMEMTMGLGKIISSRAQDSEDNQNDATMGMDMTMAMGGIIQDASPSPQPSEDIWLLGNTDKTKDAEQDVPITESRAPAAETPLRPEDLNAPKSSAAGLLALRTQALRRSIASRMLLNTENEVDARTPSPAKPSTPRRAATSTRGTPQSSPIRTPQSALKGKTGRASTSRTPSPVKATPNLRRSVFMANPDGSTRPTITLTPQPRTPTGLGADKNGLGSPQITALLERRESLVDSASKFVPGKQNVAFEDPKELMEEVDKENRAERMKGNLRFAVVENSNGSQDEKEATLNLRDKIDSLSPKRNPMRGRKSLHVGSARGLLGKRPQELDDEEEAEEKDGIKRLKGRQGSPVKNVRLQQPPTREEFGGRLAKSFHGSREPSRKITPLSFSSPLKGDASGSVGTQAFSKDNQTFHHTSVDEPPVDDQMQRDDGSSRERMHLQDFLNMTSIRFMELTTTKRRPTMMPSAFQQGGLGGGEDDLSLERCVVAGACTVPMLELYQHSCRELKKYISEGRKMVKEIETETFEENPMLFQEYMTATPEVKALMDNQFKNVKTHARHLSKAMWYEWRMKLQDGLKEGLVSIAEGMTNDEKVVAEEEALLNSVMPALTSRHESLLAESRRLEEAARELADCDPVQLQAARDELVLLGKDISGKKALIEKLRRELEMSEADVQEMTARKETFLGDIKEAEVIREECRGWTGNEVNSLKERVDAIEREHGWAITGISGSTLSMTYKREIELVLDAASFRSHQPSSRIDLWYIGDSREHNPQAKTVEKDFFLQCIRDHVRALPQSCTKISDVLDAVGKAWDKAGFVSHQIGRTNVTFPTKVIKTSDSSIAMTSSLLLVPLETRVEITLSLSGFSGPEGVGVEISSEAKVLYGEQFNVGKVGEFLAARIGDRVGSGEEEWSDVVLELHGKLIARGKKQQV